MTRLLITALTLLSLQAFAAPLPKSEKLVKILVESGITQGKELEIQEATIYCKNTGKAAQDGVVCTIYAGPPGFELNSVFEDLTGDNAKDLAKLLVKFDVPKFGKKSVQGAHFKCLVPKQDSDMAYDCDVIPQYGND